MGRHSLATDTASVPTSADQGITDAASDGARRPRLVLVLQSELSDAGKELFQKMVAALKLPSERLAIVPASEAQTHSATFRNSESGDLIVPVDPELLVARPELKREIWNQLKSAIERLELE